MNVQVKEILGGGYIKRKFLMALTIFALILQPLAIVTTAGAVASGPFNTDTVCEDGKAVLKLQAKQEVANWLTGWVTYNTPYGQTTHSLPKGDIDVLSVNTNQVELPAGATSARITGGYIQWVFFVPVTRAYDQTFSVNYAALSCDTEKPTIVVNTPDGVINPATISATATDNYRLEQVTAHMYDGTDNVLKKNCSQNVAALNVTTYEIVCPTTGLADGTYRIKANAKDTQAADAPKKRGPKPKVKADAETTQPKKRGRKSNAEKEALQTLESNDVEYSIFQTEEVDMPLEMDQEEEEEFDTLEISEM